MIVRTWRGYATTSKAGAYVGHFERNVAPELKTIEGFLGASLLRSEHEGETAFLVMTKWASMEAIKAFAGGDVTKAVVEPEAVAALTRFDDRVTLYEVVREI